MCRIVTFSQTLHVQYQQYSYSYVKLETEIFQNAVTLVLFIGSYIISWKQHHTLIITQHESVNYFMDIRLIID